MSSRDAGLLRSLIREILNEGKIPSSSIVYYQSPGSTFTKVEYPGKTTLKVLGGLYITSWLSDFVSPECLTAVSNYGMPLPRATFEFGKYTTLVTADIVASIGTNQALKTQVTTQLTAWSKAFGEDVNGTSDGAETFHKQIGGILGTMGYISANFSQTNCVWPRDRSEIEGVDGSSVPAVNLNTKPPTSQFEKLVLFVMTLINFQCENAINKEKTVDMITKKFKKRKDFVDFVKKYALTMYTDFDAKAQEQTARLANDNVAVPKSVTQNITNVKTSYTKTAALIN
jgi:hypothetical protein